MRSTVAFSFTVILMSVAGSAVQADAEEDLQEKLRAARTEFVDKAFRYADPDGDGQVTVVEQSKLLAAFYADFASAGTNVASQEKVLTTHKGLLKLQWFLSADLNDDNTCTRAELVSLVDTANTLEVSRFLDDVWTLADSDIEPLMDDFKLRIRKGVRAFNDDELRRARGDGRTKAEKLEHQSLPYRHKVVAGVLSERLLWAFSNAYKSEERAAGFKASGGWLERMQVVKDGKTTTTWHRVLLEHNDASETLVYTGSGDTRDATFSMVGGPVTEKDFQPKLGNRKYSFASTSKDSSVRVEAGTFACKHLRVELGKWVMEAWIPDAVAFLSAKTVATLPLSKNTLELIEYRKRE